MKNKKGFTLIELLAVIVVLAIIALIATPIVMNTIKKSKKGAAERSVDSYVKQLEAIEKGNASTGDDKPTIPDTPSTTVVYRWSTDEIKIGATIDPNNTSKFTKDASTLGKSYYLKHVLDKDNKVTESYACAILKGKEYCVRGGKDNNVNSFYGYAANPSDYTGNALLLKQIKDAKIEGISCSFNANYSICSDDSVYLDAGSNGLGHANGVDGSCRVNDDGSSYCS